MLSLTKKRLRFSAERKRLSIAFCKNCIIAGQVGIVGHITIADHTTIGAQSGVIGSVRKEGQTLWGYPAIDHKHYLRSYAKFKAAGNEN